MTNETLAADWRERLADFSRSGLSARQWCSEHGVASHRFYYWQRKLSDSQGPRCQGDVDWLALPFGAEPAAAPAGLTVRIGGACIDVASGFDAALLRAVCAALGAQ